MAEHEFQTEVLSRLARIEARQEVWCETRDREIKEVKADVADHEKRMRPLESQRNKILGVAAMSGVVTSIILTAGKWLWTLVVR